MILDLCYKSRGFRAADRLAFTKFPAQVLAGLIDETKNRPQRLFTTVFGIMPFAASLLVAKNCLHRRIDTDFSGLRAILFKTFTVTLFLGIVFSLFYHLGTSCFGVWLLLNPIVTGAPDGFSIIIYCVVQNRGINIAIRTIA